MARRSEPLRGIGLKCQSRHYEFLEPKLRIVTVGCFDSIAILIPQALHEDGNNGLSALVFSEVLLGEDDRGRQSASN
jgi:hypothetical protein